MSTGAAPENVLIEARGERVGQLVAEKTEVVEVEGRPYLGAHIPQHSAEHIHKVTLISHLHIQLRFSCRYHTLFQDHAIIAAGGHATLCTGQQ